MSTILGFLILAAAVWFIAMVVPGIRVKSFKTAIAVAAVYSLLNFVLFRLLLFITFPLVLLKYLTLGLFGIVINAVLLVLTDRILDDFEVKTIGAALVGAAGISLVNLLLRLLLL